MSRKLSSRRMAYIGAVLVIGLTACGSPSASSPTVSSAPASPPVIQIDGSAAATPSAAPAAEMDAAAGDSTKMMAGPINYVYDGDLVDLTAPAASWYFDPNATPTTEQIAALAAALGVDGEVRQLADDMGGGWMVGPDTYEHPDGQRRQRRHAELVVQPRERRNHAGTRVRAVPAWRPRG